MQKKYYILITVLLSCLSGVVFLTLVESPHACSGQGLQCYVEEPLIEIDDNYSNVINNHKCIPEKGEDIFTLSKHKVPSYIKSYPVKTEMLLHYQVLIPKELSQSNRFSVVIDTKNNKIFTGGTYYKLHGMVPNLISKDPPYLLNSFNKIFDKQDLPLNNLEFCKI